MTIVSSFVRNDLDVSAYVNDVFDWLLAGYGDYEAARSDVWTRGHPKTVYVDRNAERLHRVKVKSVKRDRRHNRWR